MNSLTISDRSLFLRVSDEINAALERKYWLWAILFVVLFLGCAIALDVRIPMWMDELFTLYLSRQGSVAEIFKATLEGSDAAPPLYPVIVRAILPVVGHDALAVRLPSTLGYGVMLVCLFAFCRRRLPPAYSMAAALLACDTCRRYSTEGRGYGVVLGCAAAALFCWQTAVEGRRRILALPLLALSLALMTAMHYYSMFFLVPLLLAELFRWRKSRAVDFGVLAAMTPVLLVLGLHYPFIAASARFQKHFWSAAVWSNIPEFYDRYFVTMLLMCVPSMGALAVFSAKSDDRKPRHPGLTPAEWVITGALSVMPLCIVVLSRYATHVFVPRYVLWAIPGFAVLVAALLCRVARGQAAVGVSLLCVLLTGAALNSGTRLRQPGLRDGEATRQALASLPDSGEPIIVADSHVFMELSYYGETRIRPRLIYPVSRDLDLRYRGTDTDALLFTALSHRTKLRIVEYDTAFAAQTHFVLAAGTSDYLPWHLVKTGYRVVPIGASLPTVLYEVEAPAVPNASPVSDHSY